jgi:hypothetical protein
MGYTNGLSPKQLTVFRTALRRTKRLLGAADRHWTQPMPAMAAGIERAPWSLTQIAELLD